MGIWWKKVLLNSLYADTPNTLEPVYMIIASSSDVLPRRSAVERRKHIDEVFLFLS